VIHNKSYISEKFSLKDNELTFFMETSLFSPNNLTLSKNLYWKQSSIKNRRYHTCEKKNWTPRNKSVCLV